MKSKVPLRTADVTHALPRARVRGPKLLLTAAIALILAVGMLTLAGVSANAVGEAPALGTAANFTVLGGAGVTCTSSTVTGRVGSLVSVTQTPTCAIVGTILAADAVTAQASADFLVAYTALAAMTCAPANNLTGQQLGGMTLAPDVYCFNTTADLTTGQLTLNGPSNGIWIFQIGTGITTGTASVVMAGGGQPSNVFWQVGTAATIGTGTAFQGNILAGSAITFTGEPSSLVGRALAQTAVTMTGTTVTGFGGAAN